MQAALDTSSLKAFVKALVCLAKYSDDLCIHATPQTLLLSATHSSKSAYCCFKYDKKFFSRYNVGPSLRSYDIDESGVEELPVLSGQLATKSLLSVLKHKTVEKAVDKCEITIVEGDANDKGSHKGTVESKVILRLHCKHGVTKTHRLLLLHDSVFMTPKAPDDAEESNMTIGPKTMKDIIDHFPAIKGGKVDPQLIWTFRESEVEVKSLDSSIGGKGSTQLATELSLSSDQFDEYNLYAAPMTVAFHLREFNATIAYAESMSLPMDLRFPNNSGPLFIDVQDEQMESLFVISTSQIANSQEASQVLPNYRKRRIEEKRPIHLERAKRPRHARSRSPPTMVDDSNSKDAEDTADGSYNPLFISDGSQVEGEETELGGGLEYFDEFPIEDNMASLEGAISATQASVPQRSKVFHPLFTD